MFRIPSTVHIHSVRHNADHIHSAKATFHHDDLVEILDVSVVAVVDVNAMPDLQEVVRVLLNIPIVPFIVARYIGVVQERILVAALVPIDPVCCHVVNLVVPTPIPLDEL